MDESTFACGELTVRRLIRKSGSAPALWTYFDAEEARMISEKANVNIFNIEGIVWNRDLSPFEASPCFRDGGAFTGGADAHITLLKDMIPKCEAECGIEASPRLIAGYSLAGLFAVYAMLETDLFEGAASGSGSFWFPGFDTYLKASAPRAEGRRIYLSLGDKEAKTRNPFMQCVEERTLEARDLLTASGAEVFFEFNHGGHFAEPDIRMTRAVSHLLSMFRAE